MKSSAAAFLLLALDALVTLPLVVYAFIRVDRQLLMVALGLICLGFLLLLIYRFTASSARCPLCSSPVMLSRSCARNPKARRALGSYRARVATSIVVTGKFTCPYCGEGTLCRVRQRSTHATAARYGP